MSQPYHSLEAELHDAFWDAEDDASEVALMEDFLKKHPGPSLEIGCGSGRLMYPLQARGFEIEGLELSPDMIRLGEIRARGMNRTPSIHAGDMNLWKPAQRYHSLLVPAFTLQLSSDPLATLLHWHSWLAERGGLYLTVFMPYAELLGDLPENQWYPDHQVELTGGRKGTLETRHRIDHTHRMIHREHRYAITGNPPTTHHSTQSIRWIEHSEMTTLLDRAGFELDRFYLDFNPEQIVSNPDQIDFDGILTYEASKR